MFKPYSYYTMKPNVFVSSDIKTSWLCKKLNKYLYTSNKKKGRKKKK